MLIGNFVPIPGGSGGIEFGFKNIFFVRSGVGNLQRETDFDNKQKFTCQVNLGIGINIKNIFSIDYAFSDVGDVSIALYSHIFSLKLAINQFKKNKISSSDEISH